MGGRICGAVLSLVKVMRRLFIEMLVAPPIWLVGCFAFGIALAIFAGGHGSAGALKGGLYLGATGAVGEVAYSIVKCARPYLIIDRTWGRPRLPRWFLVASWTIVSSQIAFFVGSETPSR